MDKFAHDVLRRVNERLVKLSEARFQVGVYGNPKNPEGSNWGIGTPENFKAMMNATGIDPARIAYRDIDDKMKSQAIQSTSGYSAEGSSAGDPRKSVGVTDRNIFGDSGVFDNWKDSAKPTGIVDAPKDWPSVAAHEIGHLSNDDAKYWTGLAASADFRLPEEMRAWLKGLQGMAVSGDLPKIVGEVPFDLSALGSYVPLDADNLFPKLNLLRDATFFPRVSRHAERRGWQKTPMEEPEQIVSGGTTEIAPTPKE